MDRWGATTVTGWGRTREEGEAATTLQKAHIPVVTDTKCRQVRDFDVDAYRAF